MNNYCSCVFPNSPKGQNERAFTNQRVERTIQVVKYIMAGRKMSFSLVKYHTWSKESTRNGLICTTSTHRRSTIKADTRMPHWQSVCPIYDPMAQDYPPMIGRMDGRD
ncbi:hypothetical protein Tco_0812956 [Tanacetum coccineum]